MGCKAEGAAQGYTVLGGIVLAIFAINSMINGFNTMGSNSDALVDIFLAIALLLMVILAFDASGFILWKIRRSGPLLALFGLFAMIIVDPSIIRGNFDIISWLMSIGTLAGFMILIAGLLITLKGT